MNKNDKIIVLIGIAVLIIASIGVYVWVPQQTQASLDNIDKLLTMTGTLSDIPNAVTVSSSSPYYALIATPLTVHYTTDGEQEILPLYIKDLSNPSKAITRAEDMIGTHADLYIGSDEYKTLKDYSLEIAETYWKNSKAALLIQHNETGYKLGVAAAPIASYLNIPIIVAEEMDADIQSVLENLGIKATIVCGDIRGYGEILQFTAVNDIVNATIELVEQKFGDINYITLANPLDIREATILDSTEYHFDGTVSSTTITPTHIPGVLGLNRDAPPTRFHEFEIPNNYTYARIIIEGRNLAEENVAETGGQLILQPHDPEGNLIGFLFTIGGVPERDSTGAIIEDKIHWETIVYNQPGTYDITASCRYMTTKTGEYEVDVTIEHIADPVIPHMPGLSSIAPYLTAYHQGVLVAKPEFAFVGAETIIPNPDPGIIYPASNPGLIEDVNDHVYKIHEEINDLLAYLDKIELESEDDLKRLKSSYEDDPVYLALVGDSVMLPHYYYYDTEDAITLYYGWDVAGDHIYGNIDPEERDDKKSIYQDDEFSKYPYQENIVGRITGWDVQDANALILRTIFYDHLLQNINNNDWKDTATVQTGSGTDFQKLPGVTAFRSLFGVTMPTKWPTGQAHFENMMISEQIAKGGFEVISTENIKSSLKGFEKEILDEINDLGILNRLLFPKHKIYTVAGDDKIHGRDNQENSNFIYSFAHGQPMGFVHADVQLDSLAFRPIILGQLMNRWGPLHILPPSGLSTIGGYNVRSVSNMELGPSVMMVESCYVGRIDGLNPECCISQAYLHSGVNSFIASSRGTPGPGYLDARKRAVGLGIREFIQTSINPDLQDAHFSSLHAMNIFEDLTEHDTDVGTAFRNAKNAFLPMDANSTFFWTPPLALSVNTQTDRDLISQNFRPTSDGEDAKVMDKKYTCLYEYNLFGDPAFNPYEPVHK